MKYGYDEFNSDVLAFENSRQLQKWIDKEPSWRSKIPIQKVRTLLGNNQSRFLNISLARNSEKQAEHEYSFDASKLPQEAYQHLLFI